MSRLAKLHPWRWGIYAAIVVTVFAGRAISVRYGWWPVGALVELVPVLLTALAIVVVREARASMRQQR
jgi:hypothetical protein